MSLLLSVSVVPGSGQQECFIDKNGTIKCLIKSQAEKGKANKELLKLLARYLHLSPLLLRIKGGAAGRKKYIMVDADISMDYALSLFSNQSQTK